MTADRQALYTKEDPPGDPIPVVVAPFDVRDTVPDEEEIANAVCCLRHGKASGPSGMKPNHFKDLASSIRSGGEPQHYQLGPVGVFDQALIHYG